MSKAFIPFIASVCFFLAGCYGTHFHNRSVVHYITQNAETYGTITNNSRESGTQSVDAEKTTDLNTAVSANSAAPANATQDTKKDTQGGDAK